jgi:hypothetical protein
VELASLMTGAAVNIRTPDYEDFIAQVRQAYTEASSPWRPPSGLRRLNDAYNAQTLHPCFVPKLLVDPGGEWLAAVSTGGPQVITGVRGCGKTMLLRALQFHARLSAHQEAVGVSKASVSGLIKGDGYVGLYLSARRLLDALGSKVGSLHEPYARLLVGYAREGVRAARHLAEVEQSLLEPKWWEPISTAVAAVITNAEAAGIASSVSPQVLERRLQSILFSLDRNEPTYSLSTNPAIAFPALGEAVLEATRCWSGSKLLFLLDDVSTRHLQEQSIEELLGTLLFSHDRCAFKMTTEGQTLELALKTPGLIERARADRDYQPFDLAARVNERLKDRRRGKEFLANILQLRAKQFERHPPLEPAALLGDTSLEDIARHIVATGRTAGERNKTYWGLSALAAVCVGDIGDVLNIYDSMLRKAGGDPRAQISREIQNEAFQDYSSRRLYHLNRRNGELKDFAMSFAKAAHDLLQRSARSRSGDEPKRDRLRQYTQLYVRITTGDERAQFNKLRELIDAGVFVLESGADAPRKKTRDSDPISQFILTYRKLFGLSQYIGLAFSDRFELSGDQLAAWLSDPAEGRAVLMKNLGGPLSEEEQRPAVELAPEFDDEAQLLLGTIHAAGMLSSEAPAPPRAPQPAWTSVESRVPRATSLLPDGRLAVAPAALVLGLGFEDRCLASAQRVLELACPSATAAVLVRYDQVGHGEEIERMVRARVSDVQVVEYRAVAEGVPLRLPPGPVLIDVTGLAKPVIFRLVREALMRDEKVIVVHTHAEIHFPLDSDVAGIFADGDAVGAFEILERAGRIWSGEQGPYSFVPLLVSDVDDSRPNLLCAAASAKHERLLSLMDSRQYDAVDVVAPERGTSRSRLARLGADVATRGIEASVVSEIDSDDLSRMLSFLTDRFRTYYLDAGFGIEFGLTGSKMHAVACAVASTTFKIAQAWYVSPTAFDPERFTRGVGETRWFAVERSGDPGSEGSDGVGADLTRAEKEG